MDRVSNSSGFFHRHPPAASPVRICRPARQTELRAALSLILSTHGRLAGDEQVVDFLRFATQRGMNLNDLWVVESRGRHDEPAIVWAAFPVVSPGRTLLLISPGHPQDQTHLQAASELIPEICAHWAGRGVQLAQVLLEPSDHTSRDLYCGCSFDALAELIYLQAPAGRNGAADLSANGLTWHTYDAANHALFAQVIAESYDQSLDCPALNGRRDIEDVIAGHKAAGEFDPTAWLLLCHRGRALGVLLLAHWRHSDVLELVYVGLTPAARGRGLSDMFMSRALHETRRLDCATLSLAVDSRNFPALKLYYRHGMQRICTKSAMLRDLRRTSTTAIPVASSAISPG